MSDPNLTPDEEVPADELEGLVEETAEGAAPNPYTSPDFDGMQDVLPDEEGDNV